MSEGSFNTTAPKVENNFTGKKIKMGPYGTKVIYEFKNGKLISIECKYV